MRDSFDEIFLDSRIGSGGSSRPDCSQALAVRPVIVSKHPQKICCVHSASYTVASRIATAIAKSYDDYGDMITAPIASVLTYRKTIKAAPRLFSLLIIAFSSIAFPVFAQTPAQTRQQLLNAIESNQFKDAVLLGQQAVSRWPRDPEFRHYLGVAYFKSGDPKQAQDQLVRARDLNPKDSATRFDLALVLLSQQNYPEAADELVASTKLNPSNPLAHVLLGRAYLNSNRSVQAINEFKAALKLDPSLRLGHYHLGFAYSSLGRNDEAIGEYKEELRHSGDSPALLYELGRSLLEKGQYDDAVTYLSRATQFDPSDHDAWYNLGKAQVLAQQFAPAVA
jgi:tetratricopeptide (TPR) repeat protein